MPPGTASALQVADIESFNHHLEKAAEIDRGVANELSSLANQFRYDELLSLLGASTDAVQSA